MTIAQFSMADASIAEHGGRDGGKKSPPKRTTRALADSKLAPEPR